MRPGRGRKKIQSSKYNTNFTSHVTDAGILISHTMVFSMESNQIS